MSFLRLPALQVGLTVPSAWLSMRCLRSSAGQRRGRGPCRAPSAAAAGWAEPQKASETTKARAPPRGRARRAAGGTAGGGVLGGKRRAGGEGGRSRGVRRQSRASCTPLCAERGGRAWPGLISALPGPGGPARHKGTPGGHAWRSGRADAGSRLRERRRVHGLAAAAEGPTPTAASPSARLGET